MRYDEIYINNIHKSMMENSPSFDYENIFSLKEDRIFNIFNQDFINSDLYKKMISIDAKYFSRIKQHVVLNLNVQEYKTKDSEFLYLLTFDDKPIALSQTFDIKTHTPDFLFTNEIEYEFFIKYLIEVTTTHIIDDIKGDYPDNYIASFVYDFDFKKNSYNLYTIEDYVESVHNRGFIKINNIMMEVEVLEVYYNYNLFLIKIKNIDIELTVNFIELYFKIGHK